MLLKPIHVRRALLSPTCNTSQRKTPHCIARYSQANTQPERHYPAIQSRQARINDGEINDQLGVNLRIDGDFEPADPRPPSEDKKGNTDEISDREWEIRTGEFSSGMQYIIDVKFQNIQPYSTPCPV